VELRHATGESVTSGSPLPYVRASVISNSVQRRHLRFNCGGSSGSFAFADHLSFCRQQQGRGDLQIRHPFLTGHHRANGVPLFIVRINPWTTCFLRVSTTSEHRPMKRTAGMLSHSMQGSLLPTAQAWAPLSFKISRSCLKNFGRSPIHSSRVELKVFFRHTLYALSHGVQR